MTILSKTLLTVAITGLAGGSVIDFYYSSGANPAFTALLPAGAIALGLFIISFMMEEQMAVYDREQAEKLGTLEHAVAAAVKKDTHPCAATIQLKKAGTANSISRAVT